MIKEVSSKDLKQALDLVNDVFSEFVAVDYSEVGRTTFETYLKTKYDNVLRSLEMGCNRLWGYYENDKIIGVISTENTSHISLMFVAKQHHRKGIARKLFDIVREDLVKQSTTQITVNSSPYAVKVYESLGFVKTGEQQENDGIIFIPMDYSL